MIWGQFHKSYLNHQFPNFAWKLLKLAEIWFKSALGQWDEITTSVLPLPVPGVN